MTGNLRRRPAVSRPLWGQAMLMLWGEVYMDPRELCDSLVP